MTKQIIIQRKNTNEWSAHLREGNDGKGVYGATAEIAEAKLRAAYDCEGVEAEVVESIFDRATRETKWTDGLPVQTDANGMVTI
jgi:hypothetical protein